jgi:hypothetical protein
VGDLDIVKLERGGGDQLDELSPCTPEVTALA